MRLSINQNTLEILHGDITDQDTEAIVNAANNQLWMGGGVAGAIKKQGGQTIEEEAMKQGPIDVGGAVLTTGGSLKAKYVIHAAAMRLDLHTDATKVAAATRSAFGLAEQKGITSISIPAIGTGVGGFPVHHCAKIMLTEAVTFLTNSRKLRLIRFVLYDEASFHVFQEELRMEFSTRRR